VELFGGKAKNKAVEFLRGMVENAGILYGHEFL